MPKVEFRNGTLYRHGCPYEVRGAGARSRLETLKATGGNSIRTWGAGDDIRPLLDQCEKLGLTVMVGHWLGHKEHGFDYDNPAQVRKQFDDVRAAVRKFKDHPALLCWGVGNEMELAAPGASTWKAVEEIAAMIRTEDPEHPPVAVVADMWPEKMEQILAHTSSLAALGVNSYGGLPTLHERMARWTKPYLVTEFGIPGGGDYPQTPWKRPLEPTSTEKARRYEDYFSAGIQKQRGRVCGSYVFYWGQSEVGPASWHNAFLATGERLALVDTMQRLWRGRGPRVPVPELRTLEPRQIEASPGASLSITLEVRSRRKLEHRYYFVDDGGVRFSGDFEVKPRPIAEGVFTPGKPVLAPKEPGLYRLLLISRDDKGGASVGTIAMKVT
jgi:hypothetical protein